MVSLKFKIIVFIAVVSLCVKSVWAASMGGDGGDPQNSLSIKGSTILSAVESGASSPGGNNPIPGRGGDGTDPRRGRK